MEYTGAVRRRGDSAAWWGGAGKGSGIGPGQARCGGTWSVLMVFGDLVGWAAMMRRELELEENMFHIYFRTLTSGFEYLDEGTVGGFFRSSVLVTSRPMSRESRDQ